MKSIISYVKKLKDNHITALFPAATIVTSIIFLSCLFYLKYYGFADTLSGYFPNGVETKTMARLVNHYEILIYGLILLLPLVGAFYKKRIIPIIFNVISFAGTLIFCLDCAVKRIFDKRIIFGELFGYGKDTSYYGDFIIYYFRLIGGHVTLLILALLGLYCYLCRKLSLRAANSRFILLALPVLLISVGTYNLYNPPGLILSAYSINNLYKVNNSTDEIPYSPEFKLPANWQVAARRFGEINKKKNVVLLFVESLDGGLIEEAAAEKLLVPNIKKLISAADYYENYYSNAFNSSDARFSLLSGHPRINGTTVFSKEYYYKNNFISFLNDNGYKTELFTSTPDLYGAGLIYKNAGFTRRVDFKDEVYKEARRYVFDSIDDKKLLANLLANIKAVDSEQPYFMMAVTATTHAPYQIPDTEEYSIDGCLQYADQAIGEFVAKLKETDFFENGLLVITGDHHSMRPVTAAELEKHGIYKAAHHVPLMILGAGHDAGQVHKEYLDHSSLGPLLEYLATGAYELNRFQQSPEKPAAGYIVLCQPYFVQDTALAISAAGVEQITLNSDKTGFVNTDLNEKYRDYLWYLAWLRQQF